MKKKNQINKKYLNKKIQTTLVTIMMLLTSFSFFSIINNSSARTMAEKNGEVTKSVLWTIGSGLEGEITTKLLLGDLDNDNKKDSVLIGTTNAVWLINLENGEVIIKYLTKSYVSSISFIEDKNNDGLNDILISTLSKKEPNVLLIDSVNGKVIWQFEPKAEVFTEYLGFQEMETRTWCVATLENYNGEENVITSSWQTIYLLNGRTGKIIWSFEGNNDIWSCSQIKDLTKDKNNDVIAGSQNGDVYLLDGINGKVIWQRDLTKSYKLRHSDSEEGNEIDLNVWNVLEIEDIDNDRNNDVVVTSENGYVYLLKGDSGEEIWNFKIMELKKVERETGFGSLNFFNLKVQIVGDLDGDEKDDIIILKRILEGKDMSFVQTEDQGIIALSSNPKKSEEERQILEIKKSKNEDISKVEYIYGNRDFTNDGINNLVVPIMGDFQGSQIQFFITHKGGGYLADTLFDFRYEEFSQVNFVNESLMILGSDNGIMLVDLFTKKIIWDKISYKDLEIRDFSDINNDGFSDLLFIENYRGIRRLRLVDRKTGKQFWEYSISLNDLTNPSLSGITIIPDMSNDGISDIICFSTDYNFLFDEGYKKSNLDSRVYLIDGKTGNIVWNVTPTPFEYYTNYRFEDWDKINKRIISIDYIKDIDGDNIIDIILGGEEMSIYFLSGKNGSLIEHYSQKFPDENENPSKIKFRAYQNDDWKYSWTSNLDGKLNESFDCEFDTWLSFGKHEITLLVTDKNNPNNTDLQKFRIKTFPPETHYWNVNIEGNWTWEDDNTVTTIVEEKLKFNLDGKYPSYVNFGDGEIIENLTWYFEKYIEHYYKAPGQYLVNFTNSEYWLEQNETKLLKIIVREKNQPIAEIGINNTEKNEINNNTLYNSIIGANIEFRSDSNPLAKFEGEKEYFENFSWDFDDGTFSNEEHPQHVYKNKGLFKVTLTVQNTKGKIDTDEMIINVRDVSQPIASLQEPYLNDLNSHFEGIGKSYGKTIHDIPYNLNIKILKNENKEERILIYDSSDSKLFSLDLNEVYWESRGLYNLELIDDFDNDGFPEIASKKDDKYYIIGSKTGETLINNIIFEEVDYKYILENIEDFIEDFNGDGNIDTLCYIQRSEPIIYAIDGNTNRELWRFDEIVERNWDSIPPMILIDDVNGDNVKDVAVATQRTDNERGGEISILDGKTGKKIKTLEFEKQKYFDEWIRVMSLGIKKINDVNGDGTQDFALIKNSEDETELVFIDSNSGLILRSFPFDKVDIQNNIDVNGDKKSDHILITDYNVYCLNSDFSVKILGPKSGEMNSDEFILRWDKIDVDCEIIVDEISYGYFSNGEKKLKLSSGKHEIVVKIYDEFGGSVSDRIYIEIPQKFIIKIINYSAIGTIIALIAIKIALPRIRRKKRKMEMQARIMNKKQTEKNKTPNQINNIEIFESTEKTQSGNETSESEIFQSKEIKGKILEDEGDFLE